MRKADNRLPIYLLAVLVLIALIWRGANPPAPSSPGPHGEFPTWVSSSALGTLEAHAVSPPGTAWAGIWNHAPRDEAARASVRIIDFHKPDARTFDLEDGLRGISLAWAADQSLRVLAGRADEEIGDRVIYINSQTAEASRTVTLQEPVRRIIAWPAGSAVFVALKDSREPALAIYGQAGDKLSADIEPELPRGAQISDAVLSTERSSFVYSVLDKAEESGRAYYLGDGRTGASRRLFGLADLPGKVEDIYFSGDSVLVVCSERSRVTPVLYDIESGKLSETVPASALNAFGPKAMEPVMLVTYDGGYRYDPRIGKTSRIFDLSKAGAAEGSWREYIQGGRLYPVGDGYVSVATSGKAVDIRQLRKNGSLERDLLARF